MLFHNTFSFKLHKSMYSKVVTDVTVIINVKKKKKPF